MSVSRTPLPAAHDAILPLEAIARVPAPGDNVAIATRPLEAGTRVRLDGGVHSISHGVLEGHRFAIRPIREGEGLLSWGLPFGIATRDIAPGEYVCNQKILRVLAEREVPFELPPAANFVDHIERYTLEPGAVRPGVQVAPVARPGTFLGYERPGGRGAGTRNFLVVLGTTSLTAGFARGVADRLAPEIEPWRATRSGESGIDGVVAVTHTEGGGRRTPNNLQYILRTLAGFMVHPNVGGILALDYGTEPFTNETLERFMREQGYPLDAVRHRFMRIDRPWEEALEEALSWGRRVIPEIGGDRRTPVPLRHLKLALQCGGSDAFSGVSGNALAGWVAKELLRHGGAANLAETDELIGAEPYVLANVRDEATARAFLAKIEAFKQYAANHGTSAEGNPSGGNNYRGLYNIALKSIGAARKKAPEVRLDYVIDYAAPMREPGYYFMDSPGNDLESIAGQVASGANLILFITGNGSITNFPFVPTLKFVTTTGRFELLANEMDVNAGRYNDGMPMDELGEETFRLAIETASGRRSKGELAGHAQVSIWRDWPRTSPEGLEAVRGRPEPEGVPLEAAPHPPSSLRFAAIPTPRGHATDQVGLVMPTSLCSGQVARLIAEHLSGQPPEGVELGRFVALVHTEGCGSNNTQGLFLRTLLGHLCHPMVRHAVLLEHGCEQTHNDAVRHYLSGRGLDVGAYGWASVQLDGGIARVRDKVAALFAGMGARSGPLPPREEVGASELRLGLLATGAGPEAIPERIGEAFGRLAAAIARAGGTVVIPENAPLLRSGAFLAHAFAHPEEIAPTLPYGGVAERPGLHLMETPTENPVETLTGLGATGVEVMLAHIGEVPLQAHPMIPLVQVSGLEAVAERYGSDLDRVLDRGAAAGGATEILEGLIAEVASGRYAPRLYARGVREFQLTRGLLGLSM